MNDDMLDKLDWALNVGNLTQGARLMLVRLCRAADERAMVRSISEFARAARVGRKTLQRHLDQMVRGKLVRLEYRSSRREATIRILFPIKADFLPQNGNSRLINGDVRSHNE